MGQLDNLSTKELIDLVNKNEPVYKPPSMSSGLTEDVKGYYQSLHEPTEPATSAKDFATRVLPESIGKTTVGMVEYPYHLAKSFTDPLLTKKPLSGMKDALLSNVDAIARGTGEPIGLYGLKALKERWLSDPVGSALGVMPLLSGLKLRKVKPILEEHTKTGKPLSEIIDIPPEIIDRLIRRKSTEELINIVEQNKPKLVETPVMPTPTEITEGIKPFKTDVINKPIEPIQPKGAVERAQGYGKSERDIAKAKTIQDEMSHPDYNKYGDVKELYYGRVYDLRFANPDDIANINKDIAKNYKELGLNKDANTTNPNVMMRVLDKRVGDYAGVIGSDGKYYPSELMFGKEFIEEPKGVIERGQGQGQGQAETRQVVAQPETQILPKEQPAIPASQPGASPAMAATPPVTKEAWQMTGDEFSRIFGEPKDWAWNYQEHNIADNVFEEAKRLGKYKTTEILPGVDKYKDKFNHYIIVKNALSEGKPIPPEILKDYPDLQKKAEAIPPEVKKPSQVVTEKPTTMKEAIKSNYIYKEGRKWRTNNDTFVHDTPFEALNHYKEIEKINKNKRDKLALEDASKPENKYWTVLTDKEKRQLRIEHGNSEYYDKYTLPEYAYKKKLGEIVIPEHGGGIPASLPSLAIEQPAIKESLKVEPQAIGGLKEPSSKPLPEALDITYDDISLDDAISSYEKANKEIPSWLKGMKEETDRNYNIYEVPKHEYFKREIRRHGGKDELYSGTLNTLLLNLDDQHYVVLYDALKNNKLTPQEFNKIHSSEYGKYGSESFRKQFPKIKSKENIAIEPIKKEPWQMLLLEYGKSELKPEVAAQIKTAKQVASFSVQHIKEIKAAIERGEDVPTEVLSEYRGTEWADKALNKKQAIETPSLTKEPSKVNISKAQEARKQNILKSKAPEIDKALSDGGHVEIAQVMDKATINKLNKEYDLLRRDAPIGNKEHPTMKRLVEISRLLKEVPKKPEYRLVYNDKGTFVNITKTEYDYAIGQKGFFEKAGITPTGEKKIAQPPLSAAEILIRESTPKEEKTIKGRREALNNIPEKEGYKIAYKPYGEQGRGFYYIIKETP